ncbi:MAG: SH3 domain-containing protein [Gammaproteobacteria bacterium]|nr:SH3 domain-containing protein [Gammaproteobacteria bacterium]
MRKQLLLAAALMMAGGMAQAEESFLYILSARAKLFAEPSFQSKSLEKISKGQKVVSLQKTNNWFKVKYRDQVGWLSRLSVSPHPPMKRVSLLAKGDDNLIQQSRMRSSAVSTTAAVRGLRDDGSRARVSDKNVANFTALTRVETSDITDHDVELFLAELN